jgi:hypothetical protein
MELIHGNKTDRQLRRELRYKIIAIIFSIATFLLLFFNEDIKKYNEKRYENENKCDGTYKIKDDYIPKKGDIITNGKKMIIVKNDSTGIESGNEVKLIH